MVNSMLKSQNRFIFFDTAEIYILSLTNRYFIFHSNRVYLSIDNARMKINKYLFYLNVFFGVYFI